MSLKYEIKSYGQKSHRQLPAAEELVCLLRTSEMMGIFCTVTAILYIAGYACQKLEPYATIKLSFSKRTNSVWA